MFIEEEASIEYLTPWWNITNLNRPCCTISQCTDCVAFNLLAELPQHVYLFRPSFANRYHNSTHFIHQPHKQVKSTNLSKVIWEEGRVVALSDVSYNGVPQILPQKYPFPWTDPQNPLPASSLDPSDLWCQTASRSNLPFFHNALDRLTYCPRESLTTIGRCTPTATRPNNHSVQNHKCHHQAGTIQKRNKEKKGFWLCPKYGSEGAEVSCSR